PGLCPPGVPALGLGATAGDDHLGGRVSARSPSSTWSGGEVKQLSAQVVARLQAEMRAPDLTGTRYRLLRYLARGGMGSVWLVEDTVLERQVALKVLDLAAPADDLAERLLQ